MLCSVPISIVTHIRKACPVPPFLRICLFATTIITLIIKVCLVPSPSIPRFTAKLSLQDRCLAQIELEQCLLKLIVAKMDSLTP